MEANMAGKRYKLGYCMCCILDIEQKNSYEWLKEKAALCEKFVLGIPDEWVVARLYGDTKSYSAVETRQFMLDLGWFTDVIILDAENLDYQKIYRKVPFDVCFYGSKFGQKYEKDKVFAEERGIAFISLDQM